jgi:hypothetical protein
MQADASDLSTDLADMRYFETKTLPAPKKPTPYVDFLRNGQIDRNRPNWEPVERRYLSYEEVAERTGKFLAKTGERTHEKLNSFHRSIRFPKVLFHRTLKGTPHLGYCHVTAAKTDFAEFSDVRWAFYIANFYADIATDALMFEKIDMRARRMYFAVAMEQNEDSKRLVVNRSIRGDGLLFQTEDPKAALKNVLMLGARHDTVRKIIRAL